MSDTAKALEVAARAVETILDDAYHAGRDEPPAEHTARACILAYLRSLPDRATWPSAMIAAIEGKNRT